MNKRKLLASFAILALLVSVLAGCGPKPQPTAEPTVEPVEEAAPIKIGVPTPLSPPADYKAGEINVDTVNLAIEELNKKGGALGREFEAVVADDEGDTSTGVSVVTKLITEDKVVALVGPWHSSVALAQSKIADEYKVPIFLHYSWTDEITTMHSDYVFRVSPYNSEIAQLVVPFIKEQGYKHIGFMAEDSAYGTGFADGLTESAGAEGVEVTTRVFPAESMDLSPQLLEFKSLTPPIDLLVIAAVYQPMYLIPKQAREVGLTCDIMAGWDYPGWSPEYWETTGDAGVGVFYPTFYSSQLTLSPLGTHFKEAYTAAYDHEPPIYAYYLYDEVMMIAEAIEQASSTDPEKIAEVLRAMEFDGTTGKIKFERRDTPGDPVWNQWLGHQIFIMRPTEVGQMQDQAEIFWP
jgi:branched-chain amino acid transport system substrate-binding protein